MMKDKQYGGGKGISVAKLSETFFFEGDRGIVRTFLLSVVRSILRFDFLNFLIVRFVINNLSVSDVGIQRDPDALRLLVLNEERYRHDLAVLDRRPDVVLLFLPSRIQSLVNAIWLSPIRRFTAADPYIFLRESNSEIISARKSLRRFLKFCIRRLQQEMNIHALVTCTFYYRQDRDWEVACSEIDFPFFVLHKENMKDPVIHDAVIRRYVERGFKFYGTKLFLGNHLEKEVVLKAGCAADSQVSVVGALRMDDLFESVSSRTAPTTDKTVVLFSTHHKLGLLDIEGVSGLFNLVDDRGFVRHFDTLHRAVGALALEYPNVKFVIKAKWLGPWKELVDRAIFNETGYHSDDIHNLLITDSISAHELIASATVVLGLNSTALLEAKLYGIPVIAAVFEEALENYFDTNVYFHNYMDAFSVANSSLELKEYVRSALRGDVLKQKPISEDMIADYLGYFDGNVANRIVDQMKFHIGQL